MIGRLRRHLIAHLAFFFQDVLVVPLADRGRGADPILAVLRPLVDGFAPVMAQGSEGLFFGLVFLQAMPGFRARIGAGGRQGHFHMVFVIREEIFGRFRRPGRFAFLKFFSLFQLDRQDTVHTVVVIQLFDTGQEFETVFICGILVRAVADDQPVIGVAVYQDLVIVVSVLVLALQRHCFAGFGRQSGSAILIEIGVDLGRTGAGVDDIYLDISDRLGRLFGHQFIQVDGRLFRIAVVLGRVVAEAGPAGIVAQADCAAGKGVLNSRLDVERVLQNHGNAVRDRIIAHDHAVGIGGLADVLVRAVLDRTGNRIQREGRTQGVLICGDLVRVDVDLHVVVSAVEVLGGAVQGLAVEAVGLINDQVLARDEILGGLHSHKVGQADLRGRNEFSLRLEQSILELCGAGGAFRGGHISRIGDLRNVMAFIAAAGSHGRAFVVILRPGIGNGVVVAEGRAPFLCCRMLHAGDKALQKEHLRLRACGGNSRYKFIHILRRPCFPAIVFVIILIRVAEVDKAGMVIGIGQRVALKGVHVRRIVEVCSLPSVIIVVEDYSFVNVSIHIGPVHILIVTAHSNKCRRFSGPSVVVRSTVVHAGRIIKGIEVNRRMADLVHKVEGLDVSCRRLGDLFSQLVDGDVLLPAEVGGESKRVTAVIVLQVAGRRIADRTGNSGDPVAELYCPFRFGAAEEDIVAAGSGVAGIEVGVAVLELELAVGPRQDLKLYRVRGGEHAVCDGRVNGGQIRAVAVAGQRTGCLGIAAARNIGENDGVARGDRIGQDEAFGHAHLAAVTAAVPIFIDVAERRDGFGLGRIAAVTLTRTGSFASRRASRRSSHDAGIPRMT